ncbi:MAG: L-threonylcarbamoyladenylate synthase [Legionellaceae bacterium]|nr:L-threonylcarbamoyladenylate synthase [Legionellaceae bacterium]
MLIHIDNLDKARESIYQGNILAYPTEAVYGLGCDPFNEQAVLRILSLKHRLVGQGLIVLISQWSQLFPLIGTVTDSAMETIRATWPGPTTWVFPKSTLVPTWVSGHHPSIAIRMTTHPVAAQLCQDGPLVSTSANIHGQEPARSLEELENQFPSGIDAVVLGSLGQAKKPSSIYDALTGEQLR